MSASIKPARPVSGGDAQFPHARSSRMVFERSRLPVSCARLYVRSMRDTEADLRPILRIDFPPDDRLGRGKIMLLEHIRETGSISAAGRAMDMSYRRAWLLVDALNRMFKEPAVDSQRGGKQGGGAVLTAFGEMLIERFRAMEAKAQAAIADDLDWLGAMRDCNGAPQEEPAGKPF
jgi:molybdate transport system regulatory protein